MAHKKDPDFEGFDEEIELDVNEAGNNQDRPELTRLSREELMAQLTAAEAKANENWETSLRLKAEFDNMRKRNERDLAQAHKYSLEKIAQELLGVMDNLERGLALMVGSEFAAVRTGVELTQKQLQGVFDKFSIKVIDPLNAPFDPALHEAMATKEADVAPGTVVEVLQKGYQLQDRLLRPALVVVAKTQ